MKYSVSWQEVSTVNLLGNTFVCLVNLAWEDEPLWRMQPSGQFVSCCVCDCFWGSGWMSHFNKIFALWRQMLGYLKLELVTVHFHGCMKEFSLSYFLFWYFYIKWIWMHIMDFKWVNALPAFHQSVRSVRIFNKYSKKSHSWACIHSLIPITWTFV